MTNAEYIDFCFRTVFGRAAEEPERQQHIDLLDGGRIDRVGLLVAFLRNEEHQQRVREREFVPPGHFYSAVPSLADRERALGPRGDEAPGVDLNEAGQLALLESLLPFCADCPFPEQATPPHRYHFENPAYSYTDALFLHGMMRRFRPRRIVEVGSGWSSCAILDTNDAFFDGGLDLTLIEPYPELLRSLTRAEDGRHPVIAEPEQTVGLDVFRRLEANDILFIDSSHVCKLGSDVLRYFVEILPALAPGVLVHFHDIFWPFEYPDDWIREGRAWNEAYVLRAFLACNAAFEIQLFASWLHRRHGAWLEEHMPRCRRNGGGNIWLRRAR